LGIVENITIWVKYKQDQLLKKTDGFKGSRHGYFIVLFLCFFATTGFEFNSCRVIVARLDDAHQAGKSKSQDCTLILIEGNAAKTLADPAVRDLYGVFSLRGTHL